MDDSVLNYVMDLIARQNAGCQLRKKNRKCKETDCVHCLQNGAMQTALKMLDSVALLELDSRTRRYTGMLSSPKNFSVNNITVTNDAVNTVAQSQAECFWEKKKKKCKDSDCDKCPKNEIMQKVKKEFNAIEFLELDIRTEECIKEMTPVKKSSGKIAAAVGFAGVAIGSCIAAACASYFNKKETGKK